MRYASDMERSQVDGIRGACVWLFRKVSARYVACEKRGGATLAEAGDASALKSGPSAFEELLPLEASQVLRVVFDREDAAPNVRSASMTARDAIRRLLVEPTSGFSPPTPEGGDGGSAPPAEVGVYDGSRKRIN
jgi:hypothetical protein